MEAWDVEVSDILMKNIDGSKKFNISGQVMAIDIYESIFNHTLTADFLINDGINLFDNFPIVGEEEISFSIKTPGSLTDERVYTFFVHDVINNTVVVNDNQRIYTIRCATKEFMINYKEQYTKKYNDSCENVINDVLVNNLKSEKTLRTELTKGVFDHLITYKRPFQVIDLVAERAVSKKYASSLFFFFEDRDGYNFATLEHLFATRKRSIGDKEFFFNTGHQIDIREANKRNVLHYNTPRVGDNYNKINRAALNSITRSFDILTGSITEFGFNIAEDFQSFEGIDTGTNQDFNSSTYINLFGNRPAKRFMVLEDISRPKNFYDEKVGFKKAFMERLTQYMVQIRTYGDTEITCGDVIKLNVLNFTGETSDPKEANYIPSNYMVSSLRHLLNRDENGGFEHYTNMELVKGSLLERV